MKEAQYYHKNSCSTFLHHVHFLLTLYGEQVVPGLKANNAIALCISLVIVPSIFAGGNCFLAYLEEDISKH